MYSMRKSEHDKFIEIFYISFNLKYIFLFMLIILVSAVFSGCVSTVQLMNTPTPLPTATPVSTASPAPASLASPDLQSATSSNAAPVYNEDYPAPEIIGNSGANIENGGLSTSDRNKIYYIDNGIWSMSKDGTNQSLITDMQNISCLNNAGDYIYFLSSHDGTIYRVEKEANSVPEPLNITGAANLIVIDNYMYYCASAGNDTTLYIHKSPLYGNIQECLFIAASSITPDGVYLYFNNTEDNDSLWRYDTFSSQVVKISNDKASQINIIDDKLYYISQDSDYNVVCVDRQGLNQVVVVTNGCTDLNIINDYLIYRTIDTGYIQSYNIKTGQTVPLVSYGKLFSLSVTDNMIFFQGCPADGFEPETYFYNIVTSKLSKSLPQIIYAVVKYVDADTLTFDYDRVDFYIGEEAVQKYSAYNNSSIEKAQKATETEEGYFYIYNKQVAWIRGQAHDWSSITLIRRSTSLSNNTPYTASLNDLNALFDNNPKLEGKLLFELTIIDKKVVEMNEIYYAIETNN